MAGLDFGDAATDAYAYTEAVADRLGEEEVVEDYFKTLVEELMALCPAVRGHFVETFLGELKEEVARREDPKHSHATVELITRIENDWRNRG
ncbi:MAG: hypothetical protein ACR2HO_02965 [Rubrobacteraceae bacterium]